MITEDKQRIGKLADDYAFQVPYDGPENFYNKAKHEGYIAGATAEHELLTPQLEYANSTIKKLSAELERSEKLLQEYREVIRELFPIAEERLRRIVNYDMPDYHKGDRQYKIHNRKS